MAHTTVYIVICTIVVNFYVNLFKINELMNKKQWEVVKSVWINYLAYATHLYLFTSV